MRSYRETIEGSRLTVDVTGTRNASAELIVFDRATSAALVESVTLDDTGAGRLVLEWH